MRFSYVEVFYAAIVSFASVPWLRGWHVCQIVPPGMSFRVPEYFSRMPILCSGVLHWQS